MHAHEWIVVAEFDAGYAIGQCVACGEQDLLEAGDLLPAPRSADEQSKTPAASS